MARLLVISNRLPVSVSRQRGEFVLSPSAGGLVTGLASVAESLEMHWIGWPGMPSNRLSEADREGMRSLLAKDKLHPVFLSRRDVEDYYYGFANKTIWPLFHYFPQYALYKENQWKAYMRVNRHFADEVVRYAEPGDRIWVHDYQLLLLPWLLREQLPEASIGFFLHIPFPSSEVFRMLPWRSEILSGMLGADVVGFHTYDYMRHFLSSAARIEGVEHSLGKLVVHDRLVTVDAFPMGIDYERYAGAAESAEVQRQVSSIRKRIGDPKIILSLDRLDYTKGIIQRVEAFDLFLSENREYRQRVSMILLTVPSRTDIDRYIDLRRQLEGLVGRINGEHGTIGWMPIWYLYRRVPFERLVALYSIADVAIVTPLRDGMNLIAKEFIAAKGGREGVLVLSETAGAASELGEAVTVNPNNKRELIEAIHAALEMPADEQIRRNSRMQARLSRYTVHRWARDFLDALDHTRDAQQKLAVRHFNPDAVRRLIGEYRESTRRLLLLDYDGTLITFFRKAEDAVPDPQLLELLRELASCPDNEVVVVSGRDRVTLETWFADVDIGLVAEHGGWFRDAGKPWETMVAASAEWKAAIQPILDLYADRTPGSSVEEKEFSLVWHVRAADPEFASLRTSELRDAVRDLTANLDVGIFEGDKIFEIKRTGIDKGRAVARWLRKEPWDFVLAIGDDYTDEDMFGALPPEAYSIKVGTGLSRARFNVRSVVESRQLLSRLIKG